MARKKKTGGPLGGPTKGDPKPPSDRRSSRGIVITPSNVREVSGQLGATGPQKGATASELLLQNFVDSAAWKRLSQGKKNLSPLEIEVANTYAEIYGRLPTPEELDLETRKLERREAYLRRLSPTKRKEAEKKIFEREERKVSDPVYQKLQEELVKKEIPVLEAVTISEEVKSPVQQVQEAYDYELKHGKYADKAHASMAAKKKAKELGVDVSVYPTGVVTLVAPEKPSEASIDTKLKKLEKEVKPTIRGRLTEIVDKTGRLSDAEKKDFEAKIDKAKTRDELLGVRDDIYKTLKKKDEALKISAVGPTIGPSLGIGPQPKAGIFPGIPPAPFQVFVDKYKGQYSDYEARALKDYKQHLIDRGLPKGQALIVGEEALKSWKKGIKPQVLYPTPSGQPVGPLAGSPIISGKGKQPLVGGGPVIQPTSIMYVPYDKKQFTTWEQGKLKVWINRESQDIQDKFNNEKKIPMSLLNRFREWENLSRTSTTGATKAKATRAIRGTPLQVKIGGKPYGLTHTVTTGTVPLPRATTPALPRGGRVPVTEYSRQRDIERQAAGHELRMEMAPILAGRKIESETGSMVAGPKGRQYDIAGIEAAKREGESKAVSGVPYATRPHKPVAGTTPIRLTTVGGQTLLAGGAPGGATSLRNVTADETLRQAQQVAGYTAPTVTASQVSAVTSNITPEQMQSLINARMEQGARIDRLARLYMDERAAAKFAATQRRLIDRPMPKNGYSSNAIVNGFKKKYKTAAGKGLANLKIRTEKRGPREYTMYYTIVAPLIHEIKHDGQVIGVERPFSTKREIETQIDQLLALQKMRREPGAEVLDVRAPAIHGNYMRIHVKVDAVKLKG